MAPRTRLFYWVISLALGGCARGREESGTAFLQKQLSERDVALEKLGRQVEELQRQHQQRLSDLEHDFRAREREYRRELASLQRLLEEKSRRVGELELALSQARARVGEWERALALRTEAEKPPAFQEAGAPAPSGAGEVFPIRVLDVTGRRVVTGSYTVTRDVDTGEVYRDEFGERRRKFVPRQETVREYGYRVDFSLENLSDRPVEITARAGLRTQSWTLAPRAAATNLSIEAARGSALQLMVGGLSRSFPVTFTDEESPTP